MTKVYLENQYGEPVCELVADMGYYKLAEGFVFDYLAVGDIYRVVERDIED